MGGKSSQSSQQVTIPPEVLARYNAVNARAETAASTPFQQYSKNAEDFVEPLNSTQKAGISQTEAAAGQAQPYFGAATNQLMQAQEGTQPYYAAATGMGLAGARSVNPGELNVNQYMNPYLGTVLGTETALMNQKQQQEMAGQTGNAIRSGAFGGDRAGIAAANLSQQQDLSRQKMYSDILNQGYNTALSTAQQQQGVQLGAEQANRAAMAQAAQFMSGLGGQMYGQGAQTAQQLAALGTGAQTAGLQGAQAQLAAGQVAQQTGQAGKTALYNQFMQGQSYPFQVAQFLANIAEGTGSLSGSTTTTNQPGGFFSDERLKENISEIGKTHDGQPIYRYNYKGGDKRTQIGLLAQDVEHHHPEAVGLAGGYKTVDYDKATRDSMGGSVGPDDVRMGFAAGGMPDYSSMLASHAGMYQNMPGVNMAGGLAGSSGYMPQVAASANRQLATASALPQQKSTAENVHQIVQMGKDAQDAWKAAKPMGKSIGEAATGVKDWAKNFGAATETHSSSGSGSAPSVPQNTSLDDESSFSNLNRGGVAGFADGGMPYPEQQTKLDIPEEKQAHHLAVAHPLPQQKSGLDDLSNIMNIASKAASMFKGSSNSSSSTPSKAKSPGLALPGDGASTSDILGGDNSGYDPNGDYSQPSGPTGDVGVDPSYGDPYGNGGQDPYNTGGDLSGGGDGGYFAETYAHGGMTRQGLAGGGMPYENASPVGGLDIPEEKPDAKLQTAGSLQNGPSGLQNAATGIGAVGGLMNIGSKLFGLKSGGVAGRAHFEDGGPADVPYDQSLLNSFVESPVGRGLSAAGRELGQFAYKTVPNLAYNVGVAAPVNLAAEIAGGKKLPYVKHPFSDEPNLLDSWSGTPAPAEGQAKPQEFKEDARHGLIKRPALPAAAKQNVAPKPGLGQPDAFTPEQRQAAADDYASMSGVAPISASFTPEQRQAAGDEYAAQSGVTPAAASGLSPHQQYEMGMQPAGQAAGLAAAPQSPHETTTKSVEPSFLEKLKRGFEKAGMTKSENVIPLLTGLAAMGTTQTRSLGVALASGLGAGAQAWQPTQQAHAQLEKTQAETGQLNANIGRIAAVTGQTQAQAAQTWQEIMKNGFFSANGVPQVMTYDGRIINFSDWASMQNKPPVYGQPQLLGSGNLPQIPTSKVPKQISPAVKSDQANMPMAPTDEEFAPIRNSVKQVNSGMRSVDSLREGNLKVQHEIADAGTAASVNRQNLSDLSTAISAVPAGSPLSGGPFQNLIQSSIKGWNQAMRAANAPPSTLIDEGNLTESVIRDKVATGQAFANATAAGQHAYQALSAAAEAIPSGNMNRDAAIHLTARLMINNQRMIDLNNFERATRQRAANEGIGYAYDADAARNSFDNSRSRAYEERDMNALKTLLGNSGLMHDVLTGKIDRQTAERILNAPGVTRYILGQ